MGAQLNPDDVKWAAEKTKELGKVVAKGTVEGLSMFVGVGEAKATGRVGLGGGRKLWERIKALFRSKSAAKEAIKDVGRVAEREVADGNVAEELVEGVKTGERALAPAKRTSGTTVLGHYPDYKNLADAAGHRRFDIPERVWNTMSDAERWAANQKFLDRTIAKGDEIVLATPLGKMKAGDNWFRREIEYLRKKGYTPNADGTRMIPPKPE